LKLVEVGLDGARVEEAHGLAKLHRVFDLGDLLALGNFRGVLGKVAHGDDFELAAVWDPKDSEGVHAALHRRGVDQHHIAVGGLVGVLSFVHEGQLNTLADDLHERFWLLRDVQKLLFSRTLELFINMGEEMGGKAPKGLSRHAVKVALQGVVHCVAADRAGHILEELAPDVPEKVHKITEVKQVPLCVCKLVDRGEGSASPPE